jgi:pyridoxine 5-phosphate synthase
MPRLHVNIDHVATLRQARGSEFPDPVTAAALVEINGGQGITVHLREDRRHIQDRDVRILRQTVKTFLNLESAVTEEMTGIAQEVKPDAVCLVPEKRQELTTEGGLDVIANFDRIADACLRLKDSGIIVSLFIDPREKQIEAAARARAPFVELHTGQYAEAKNEKDRLRELATLDKAVQTARNYGLRVNAGHGLNYNNVAEVAAMPEIEELNIGHAIICRAVLVGLPQAVRDMKSIIDGAAYRDR